LWDQDASFYLGVAAPAVIGVVLATYMATKFKLDKPERVAVAVEACYQNTGIATSVAITMFTGDDLAVAIGVPLYYGIVEATVLAIYCLGCWKIGWTKAPTDENICVVIATSYEVEKARMESPNAIEVVHNTNQKDDQDIEDLVFTQSMEGYQVDEESLHEMSNANHRDGKSHLSDDGTEMDTPTENVGLPGGISSLRARATGYRQGQQAPDSPSRGGYDDSRITDGSVPADGKELT
jgi:hypothetical protein